MDKKIKVGIFICINDEDFKLWWQQLSENLLDLDLDVAWYLDLVSPETEEAIKSFPKTVFVHSEKGGLFSEMSRQIPMDYLRDNGYDWTFQFDSDEIIQTGSKEKLIKELSIRDGDVGRMPLETVWIEDGKKFLRRDDRFFGSRTRIYSMKNRWRFFNAKTNGPYVRDDRNQPQYAKKEFFVNIPIYHYGFSTLEIRKMHEERWNKIYGRHGGNPYGLWKDALDDSIEKVLIPYE